MLKQVCNVEVVIDGILTSVEEQLKRKSRNCTQRKHTTYVKSESQWLIVKSNMN